MQNAKWSLVVGGAVAGLSALLLSACCSTYNMHAVPEVKKQVLQLPAGLRFNLASVEFISPTNVNRAYLSDFGVIYLNDAELREHLMEHAEKTYPDVFSAAADAIPLKITLKRAAYTDNSGVGACWSCLTLTIIPIPIDEQVDYTVRVATPRADVGAKLAAPVTFSRAQVGRTSCFPTGYIPASGGKGKSISDGARAQKTCESLMLDSSVQAIVTALQRVQPDAWKTAPVPPPAEKPAAPPPP
jgi:hypothetical protein